ncbi:MAG: AMP-binding protein [Anaerolineaceae bacterium]|nr:AMP-binding protein [Anaerolineaceae bacterium]
MVTFSNVLRKFYQQAADQTAVEILFSKGEDLTLTYKDLIEGAAAYEKAFSENGIKPGEIVILIMQHSRDLICAFYGAILHGAIPSIMPFLTEKLLPERYRSDLAALIAVTQPSAIVTYRDFNPEIQPALKTDDSVRVVMISDDIPSTREPDFETMYGLKRNPEDIVLLQHSSGTTGLQKGVALSHQAVFNQLKAYKNALNFSENDVVVSWLPLYHDMGLIAGFLLPILSGAKLVLLSPFDWVRAPYRLLQAISQYRGTLTWLPNFAYNFCAKKIRDRHMQGVDLSSLRAVINCSEPMRWDSHEIFREKFEPYGFNHSAFGVSYAMAENVFAVTQGGIKNPIRVDEIDRDAFQNEHLAVPITPGKESLRILSAGKPIGNTLVKILSTDEKRRELKDREVGEIAIQSDCMLTGYYHRPVITEQSFHDGWFLTGDYGYKLDGEVYVTGRKKEIIIVGGRNVYPQDLEELAMEVPGVHPGRVVAFGIFDEALATEEVTIVAEVDTLDTTERDQIADGIREKVTRGSAIALRNIYLVNRKWLIKTSSGKNARNANRDKYIQETTKK